MDTRELNILQIEDNPGDIRLTREALNTCQIRHHLYVVQDGIKALTFLNRKNEFSDVPRPDLILLDLNLPGKDGREVLEQIKNETELRRIPVLVFTCSTDKEDIVHTYHLRANCYIVKPASLDEFIAVIKAIGMFWSTVVKLPV